jgi:DNA-binding NarL/FixJ family response regulator
MVVDDHDVVRRSLAMLLSTFEDLLLVGDAADGREAVELTGLVCPDVILMDVVMPRMDGIAATRAVLSRCPETRILVLTSHGVSGVREAAREAGASGCISKDATTLELAEALRSVARGQPVW